MRKTLLTAVAAIAVATQAWALPPGLYGIQSSNDEGNGLFRIDPATGAAPGHNATTCDGDRATASMRTSSKGQWPIRWSSADATGEAASNRRATQGYRLRNDIPDSLASGLKWA